MKVLNVCSDDYANYSYDNAMALRSIGVDAFSIKKARHAFGYKEQSLVVNHSMLIERIRQADIVQIMHSDETVLQICVALKKQNVFVYHTGTKYRMNPAHYNKVFNPHVKAAFTDQTEFIGLGGKNEQYIATAINMANYKRVRRELKRPYIIGHFPSNPGVKGTGEILLLMARMKGDFNFVYTLNKVNHEAQRKRMAGCDIYIELFKPLMNGKPYGCYGVSAFEAAACGKVVVTQNIRPHVYAGAYGDCPFVLANDEGSFLNSVQKLINTPQLEITALQNETYKWVLDKHSYQASGERLKKLLNSF